MTDRLTRRTVIGLPVGAAALLGLSALPSSLLADDSAAPSDRPLPSEPLAPGFDAFPAVDPQRVYDTVLYAHNDIDKVRALVEASPSLANAAMDWGFGDWETAIGAAGHMGRRDIAEVLISNGARPDLFTHAMLGNLDAVKTIIATQPGIQTARGPHGISLLAHAKTGGDQAVTVVAYLEELGGADPQLELQTIPNEGAAYVGTYSWGSDGPALEISYRNNYLSLVVGEGFGKGLGYLGDHEFCSTAAPSVKVRFQVGEEKATGFTIHDPDIVVSARRVT